MRQIVNQVPRQKPCVRYAWREYSEQLGVKRQQRGFRGLMKRW
jgi:hypothetical protein